MTDAEMLLAAYPKVHHAVSYVELIICQGERPTSWEVLTGVTPRVPLAEMIEILKESVTGSELPTVAAILEEMERPEFMTYLRGKLGMM